ncbi:MAG TPA: cation:proton antiporter [Acidobacteriota bacterium]|nr:cation:proton antiporter [Acidobacteriota bacterium]
MEHTVNFYPLLVVTLLAVAVPVVLQRFRVPIIAGEILAGIVVGPTVFDLLGGDPNPWLEFLKLFGFVYLMFLSGLEIDFDLLIDRTEVKRARGVKRLVNTPLKAGLLFFALTLVLSMGASLWLIVEGYGRDLVIMSLIFSTTSLGVVMPVLKERELTFTDLGQYILVASVVGDFATVFLVSAYVTVYTAGLSFEIMLILVLLAATFLIYRLAHVSRRHLPLERLVEELSHATAQLDIRGSLALAVVFIALAQGLGVEVILGAFLAGAIVSLLSDEQGSDLRPKLNALGYGFFIPIFFIMVGVDFDIHALMESPEGLAAVPIFIFIAFAVKMLAALVYRLRFTWREVIGIGSLTSARLSLIIAVAAVGVNLGALSEAMNSAIILLSLVTVVAAPSVFNRLIPMTRHSRRHVIIAGSPPQARVLAQRLAERHEPVIVVTANATFVEEALKAGIDTIKVEPGKHAKGLAKARPQEASALVCMLEDENAIEDLAPKARRELGIPTVIAYVQDRDRAERLRKEGVKIVDPTFSLIVILEAMVRHPQAFSLLTDFDTERDVRVVRMSNAALEGRRLGEVSLPGDALVLVVDRDAELVIPRGGTQLYRGDLLTVVGSPEAVELAAEKLTAH